MTRLNISLDKNNEPAVVQSVPSPSTLISKELDTTDNTELYVYTENKCIKVNNNQHLQYMYNTYSHYKVKEYDIDGDIDVNNIKDKLVAEETYYLVVGDNSIYIVEGEGIQKSSFRVPRFNGKYYYHTHDKSIKLLTAIPSGYKVAEHTEKGLPIIYDRTKTETCSLCDRTKIGGTSCECEREATKLWREYEQGLESYNHTPRFKVRKENPTDNSNQFGMELEMVGSETRHPLMVPAIKNDRFVYFMRDGSLPSYGFEQATHPFTYNYYTQERLKGKKDIFHTERYKKLGIMTKPEEQCGLHVHIDKGNFKNDDHYDVWFRLMSCNISWLEKICGRTCGEYTNTVNYPNRGKKKLDEGSDKYLIIANRSITIEFRLFKGDLDMPDFAIQFLEATINYTRGVGEGRVFGWTRFKKYLKKSIEKYPALKTRFIDNKVPKGLFIVDSEEY